PVAHVGVRRVANARLPEVAKILFVLFDLLVAAGEIQSNFLHVMDIGISDVPYRDARVRVALLDLREAFAGTQVRRRPDANVFGPDLLEEQQLLFVRAGGELCAELDTGLVRLLRSG